ncbi:MAG: amylo-alpha-1,6-glucosidase [Lentisphaeria bacterium]
MLSQTPAPGDKQIFRQGDFLTVELQKPPGLEGKAYLRTNLYRPDKKLNELIQKAEGGSPRRYQEWGDFEFKQKDRTTYQLSLPLMHSGFFEAKAFFLESDRSEPIWPEGDNLYIKVEPITTLTGNSIYSAFVRLFLDQSKLATINSHLDRDDHTLEDSFHLIPKHGTFKKLQQELDFIIHGMGFDIIMLLPIHPVPTTYARMGFLGSPYAALDFFNIDPALTEFQEESTPLEQFSDLIRAVHARGARIFMDIPANHTGWASQLQIHHPEYFIKDDNGAFKSPGAWGVTWSDLAELDYSHKGLWKYMADVFLFWCSKGIDGFRCDAGYMLPPDAWKYIIAKVRREYPATIFLLEGLGGKIRVTEQLLTDSNMDWAYSELFQNYHQEQLDYYLPEFNRITSGSGPLVNFSETHDNNRLASISKDFSRLRNGLAALFSDSGAFGITCGVEWFADEKIDVHRLTSLNWGNPENLTDYLKRLNIILKTHPAFQPGSRLRKIHTSVCNSIAYLRETATGDHQTAIIANLSPDQNEVHLAENPADFFAGGCIDILTSREIKIDTQGEEYRLSLAPYQIIALCDPAKYVFPPDDVNPHSSAFAIINERRLKCQLIQLLIDHGFKITPEIIEQKIADFKSSPWHFFYQNFTGRPPVIRWQYPQDTRREIIVPSGTPVLLYADHFYRYKLRSGELTAATGTGIRISESSYLTILPPSLFSNGAQTLTLHLEVFVANDRLFEHTAQLRTISSIVSNKLQNIYQRPEILNDDLLNSLAVNQYNSISVLRGVFGQLAGKYDAILSLNLKGDYPEDRHIMLSRYRGWCVFRGFSREFSIEYQRSFQHHHNTSEYYFEMPVGGGLLVPLLLTFVLDETDNISRLTVTRLPGRGLQAPAAEEEVKIIIRPDVENRNHHELTKAFAGPETTWTEAINSTSNSFIFSDNGRYLRIKSSKGAFSREDEWQYMVERRLEAERGLDAHGDLFSPGFFHFYLAADEQAELTADAALDAPPNLSPSVSAAKTQLLRTSETDADGNSLEILENSIEAFIVKRNSNKSVIAGYPWFLDWGRDTLICLRGLLAAGHHTETVNILKEFAALEDHGTLPNVLRGTDTSNRDTSDAPLWFFCAVNDALQQLDQNTLLIEDCGGRTLGNVLLSIVANYIEGTPNGIRMDAGSGLVYSPAHFTWMDTAHPAGTPRQGYPIEIQALWYNAVKCLSTIFPNEQKWQDLSEQISRSIEKYFVIRKDDAGLFSPEIYLSDCIHTPAFEAVENGTPDDHIRPNQLLAVTLNAVREFATAEGILTVCEELLVPGAIRTLGDRRYEFQLPVYHNGELLNDPEHPYSGIYTGDEDTSRKPAYHNGTAWTWLFPTYCEALIKLYGNNALRHARDILDSSLKLFNTGCIHQLPEIVDGDFPHRQKGCFAQAWGVTEFYRAAKLLNSTRDNSG